MLRRAIVAMTVMSVAVLVILLTTTTPSTAGPLGILVFFVFMYLSVLGVLTFLFRGTSLIISRVSPTRRQKVLPQEISFKRAYYYASVMALVPVMLIAMQSVGQIGVYQILLIGLFTIIAWLYVTNRTA